MHSVATPTASAASDQAGQVDEHRAARRGCTSTGAPSSVTRAAAPRRVEVVRDLDRHAARRRVDDDDVVARRQHEHMGEAAAQDRRRRPGGRAVRHRDVDVERRRRRAPTRRPVRAAAAPPARRSAAASMHRAGDDRRDEGPRRHGPAQLLDHDDELGQAEARAARRPRGGGGPASRGRPGRPRTAGSVSRLRLEQGPGGPAGVVLGQEVRGGLAQGAVVFGDGNRHG